jgi:methylated-DNA-protein-cysteine methyltransferase related protein
MTSASEREQRIIGVLLALRPGEVTTYGDVADVAGYPKQARLVGRILATTDIEVPWWRVVNSAGVLRASDVDEQAALLRSEDVRVVDGRVRAAPTGRFSPTRQARRSPRP